MSVKVEVHVEAGLFWATSPRDMPKWSASANSAEQLVELIFEGMRIALGELRTVEIVAHVHDVQHTPSTHTTGSRATVLTKPLKVALGRSASPAALAFASA
jgi:hypothetical protein